MNCRLFQILFILLDKGKSTASELAKHFEVSVRTIYRDLDVLSLSGIPVYTIPGRGGGIFLQKNYVLNKSLFSEQEQQQLLMALQNLNLVDKEHTNALLTKLKAVFQKQSYNWIEVDFSSWDGRNQEIFAHLQQAILQKNIIVFHYYSGKGTCQNRECEPLKLVLKENQWYLYAYCYLRKDCRLFKLNRIKQLSVTTQEFERAAPIRIVAPQNPCEEHNVELLLLFQPELAYRVYDHFEEVEERADGKLLVHASFPQHESLYGFLLSFGDKVEVLAPDELRTNLIKRIASMKNNYKT